MPTNIEYIYTYSTESLPVLALCTFPCREDAGTRLTDTDGSSCCGAGNLETLPSADLQALQARSGSSSGQVKTDSATI